MIWLLVTYKINRKYSWIEFELLASLFCHSTCKITKRKEPNSLDFFLYLLLWFFSKATSDHICTHNSNNDELALEIRSEVLNFTLNKTRANELRMSLPTRTFLFWCCEFCFDLVADTTKKVPRIHTFNDTFAYRMEKFPYRQNNRIKPEIKSK